MEKSHILGTTILITKPISFETDMYDSKIPVQNSLFSLPVPFLGCLFGLSALLG